MRSKACGSLISPSSMVIKTYRLLVLILRTTGAFPSTVAGAVACTSPNRYGSPGLGGNVLADPACSPDGEGTTVDGLTGPAAGAPCLPPPEHPASTPTTTPAAANPTTTPTLDRTPLPP